MRKAVLILLALLVVLPVGGVPSVREASAHPAAPAFQNLSEAGTTSATEITITAPAGFDAGDLFIVFITKDDDVLINEDGDWTTLHRVTSGGQMAIYCAWRIAEAGDTSWTWTGDSEAYYGAILRYTGHDGITPINKSGVAVGDDNTPTAPSIATSRDDCMIFQAFGADDDDEPYTVPSAPFTQRFNDSYTTTGGAGGDWVLSSQGATGTGIFGMNAIEEWGAVTVAIQPPWVPPIADIDVGAVPMDRPSALTATYTNINKTNPANDSGTLHSVKVFAASNVSGLIVGTFYATNGLTFKCRDSVAIGNVEAGAVRTFTELSITVEIGDYIGCYFTGGTLDSGAPAGGGRWYVSGEYIDPGDETNYTLSAFSAVSLYGYGDVDGVVVPTIVTNAASDIEDTTATLSGNITATGGENCTDRGFQWDVDSGTPYADNWTEAGNFGVGNFTHGVTSLPTGTTIYYIAGANNTAGWGWGSEVTFLTKPAAPTNVSAEDGISTENVTVTWNKSTGATGYKVYEGANLLDTLGDVATYDDTTAPAGSITSAGNVTASDGTQTAYVVLSLANEATANGATRTYKVVAFNATGDSDDSAIDTGHRGVGAITYQWQRSAADSDADYGNIGGATTDPYNDTGAPANGDGRYFQCIVSSVDASNTPQTSDNDRGYRSVTPPPPPPPEEEEVIGWSAGASLLALVLLADGLTVAMFVTRERMLGFPCVIMWAILGAFAYGESATPWGDWQYYLFFGSAFGMTSFCALAAFGLREKHDTLAEEGLEKGDGKYIDESEEKTDGNI